MCIRCVSLALLRAYNIRCVTHYSNCINKNVNSIFFNYKQTYYGYTLDIFEVFFIKIKNLTWLFYSGSLNITEYIFFDDYHQIMFNTLSDWVTKFEIWDNSLHLSISFVTIHNVMPRYMAKLSKI